jgi:hypothetical protein
MQTLDDLIEQLQAIRAANGNGDGDVVVWSDGGRMARIAAIRSQHSGDQYGNYQVQIDLDT